MGRVIHLQNSPKWLDYLCDFLLIKKINGCRERTIKDYEYHITRFFQLYPESFDDYSILENSVKDYFNANIALETCNIRRS